MKGFWHAAPKAQEIFFFALGPGRKLGKKKKRPQKLGVRAGKKEKKGPRPGVNS